MQVSEIHVPTVSSMIEVRGALEDILEQPLGKRDMRALAELVKDLDQVAWDCDGVARSGVMIGLLAGLQAGVAEGRIRAIRGRHGPRRLAA